MTLLKSIIQDPSNQMAPSDLKIIEPLLLLLHALINNSKGQKQERVSRMLSSCAPLFESAKMAVANRSLADLNWSYPSISMAGPDQTLESQGIDPFSWGTNDVSSVQDMTDFNLFPSGLSQECALAIEREFQESMAVSG